MMTVSEVSINSELTYRELRLLEALLSERTSEMMKYIEEKDPHLFLELLQLKGKINGMVFLVEDKQDKKDKKSNKLEDIEDCTNRVG